MSTGGTPLFSVPAVSYPSTFVLSFPTLSDVMSLSVKSSFAAFVSNYFTLKETSNSGITHLFLYVAFFVMMYLWVIGFSVPVEELIPL